MIRFTEKSFQEATLRVIQYYILDILNDLSVFSTWLSVKQDEEFLHLVEIRDDVECRSSILLIGLLTRAKKTE